MNLSDITPLILTYNEEANIGRCLERLTWATRVLVIDSGSDDRTLAICRGFPNVEVLNHPFDNHTAQWNFGLENVETWGVLSLDADYLISPLFIEEIEALKSQSEEAAWLAQFRYSVFGRYLRRSLYPPRAILFDRTRCRYVADGHTQLLEINGEVGNLKTRITHDDRKPLSRWLDSQRKYAALEAEKLMAEACPGGAADLLRKMIWPAAPVVLLYTLLAKRLIFDGWPGWFYALQRTCAELLLSLELLERKLHRSSRHD